MDDDWRPTSGGLNTLQLVKTKPSASLTRSQSEKSLQRLNSSASSNALISQRSASKADLQALVQNKTPRHNTAQPSTTFLPASKPEEEGELVIEYFAVCGIGAESLRESHEGGRCKPVLLDRLPERDRVCGPIPGELPQCCLPEGVEIVLAADVKEDTKPKLYPIVLTDEEGQKLYGSCLTFLDWVPEVLAVQNETLLGAKASKCLCVLSRYPFIKTFQKLLDDLYTIYFKKGGTRPMVDTLHFLLSGVPLPKPGGQQVIFKIDTEELILRRPPLNRFWSHELSLRPLAQLLDPSNLIKLFAAVLLEKQVVLLASQYTLLTNVAEGITSLLRPLLWHHVYIPVMPHALADYLDSPAPFIVGLHSKFPLQGRRMDDKVVVDLEANKVTFAEDLLPPLPQPETRELSQKLRAVLQPDLIDMDGLKADAGIFSALQGKEWGPDHDVALSTQFFEYLRSLTLGYEHFVNAGSTEPDDMFDRDGFLALKQHMKDPKSEKKMENYDPFLVELVETQAFGTFVEDHIELEQSPFIAETSQALIAKVSRKGEEADIKITAPEVDTLAGTGRRGFRYDTFPPLTEAAATQLAPDMSRHNEEPDEEENILNTLENLLSASGSNELAGLAKEIQRVKQQTVERKRRMSLGGDFALEDDVDEETGLIVRKKIDGSGREVMRTSWEVEFISKQQKTLMFAMDAAVELSVDVNKIDWDRVGDLLAIQKAGGGWDLMQVFVSKLDELELRAKPLPSGPFSALCRMIMAIAKHAADKEDFRAILTGLDAAVALHTINSGQTVKEFAIQRLRNDPLWFHPWLWDGVLTLALNDFHGSCEFPTETDNYYFALRKSMMRMAGYMTAVGVDEDGVWNMMHRKLNVFLRQHAPGKKGELLLQMRTHLSVLNMMESMKSINVTETKTAPSGEALTDVAGWRYTRNDDEDELLDDLAVANAQALGQVMREKMPEMKQTNMNKMHTKPVIRIAAKSGYAATASLDWTVRLWELGAKELKHLGPLAVRCDATSLDLDDQVSYCAIGRMDGNVRLVDCESMKQLLTFRAHNGSVATTCIDNPRHFVATGGVDGCVRVWDIRKPSKPAANLLSVGAEITTMQFKGYSDYVAVGASNGVCSLFDVRFCSVPVLSGTGHKDVITSVKIVGSGSKAALLSSSRDGTARYWEEVGRGSRNRNGIVLAGAEGPVYGATDVNLSSKDELRMLITGSADGFVRLYDSDGNLKRFVKMHAQPVMLVSSSARMTVTGSTDNHHVSWDHESMRTGAQLDREMSANIPTQKVVCFAHDMMRDFVIGGCQDGTISVWHPEIKDPIVSMGRMLNKQDDSDDDDYEWWSG